MFSLGPMEMAIVGVVAVLLFGKRLPEVMRSLGKSYNEFRRGLADIHSTVNYHDYGTSSSTYTTRKNQDFSDYEEPTAPRFEPPPAIPDDSSPPSGEIEKPIAEK
jgi:sec-independent protein translocase protein TatA